jgi:hypothetical protein
MNRYGFTLRRGIVSAILLLLLIWLALFVVFGTGESESEIKDVPISLTEK